jgi:hypothetical protein
MSDMHKDIDTAFTYAAWAAIDLVVLIYLAGVLK